MNCITSIAWLEPPTLPLAKDMRKASTVRSVLKVLLITCFEDGPRFFVSVLHVMASRVQLLPSLLRKRRLRVILNKPSKGWI